MKFKVLNKKFLSATFAAMMVASMSASAFAATTDPHMTAYNTNYSYTVDAGTADTITLKAAPADNEYKLTGYDTADDAKNAAREDEKQTAKWSVVSGSTAGVSIAAATGSEQLSNGLYASTKRVAVAKNATPGAASVMVQNEVSSTPENAYMNFSIVVDGQIQNDSDDNKNTATGITYQFYNVAADGTESDLLEKTNMTVAGDLGDPTAEGFTKVGNTLYPCVLDGIRAMNGTDLTASIVSPYGTYYAESITINGTTYAENWATGDGWQYRIYRNNQAIDLTKYIGTDECALQNGDIVVFKYGNKDIVDFD